MLAVAGLAVPRATAAGTAQIAFAPASASGASGAAVNVDITVASVDPAPGLGGYSVTVTFNPAVVHITSLQDSGWITSGQNVVICSTGTLDNAAGKATAGCTPIPLFGAPGVSTSAPHALLHASFTGVAPGTSTLSLAGSTLSAPDGTAIAATTADGSIRVTSTAATPEASARAASPTATVGSALPSATAPATTPAPAPTPAPEASSTPSEAQQAAATVLAGALKPPATGTGGGSGMNWPVVALAGLLAVGVLTIAGAAARQYWKSDR